MSDHHTCNWSTWCAMCEYEEAMGLLRQVANSKVIQYLPGRSPNKSFTTVALPDELWNQIAPLRSANKKEG